MCISVVTHLQFPVSSIFWQVQNPVKIPTSSLITKLRYQNILHQLPLTIQIFSREFPANLTYFFSIMFSYHWHNANLKKKKESQQRPGYKQKCVEVIHPETVQSTKTWKQEKNASCIPFLKIFRETTLQENTRFNFITFVILLL